MLVVGEALHDAAIRDLPQFLEAGDVMVFNDTRVIPARLFGKRGDAKVEILLHRLLEDSTWLCFARPGKRLKKGDRVVFADDFEAEVESKKADGQVVLSFDKDASELRAMLDRHGHMPLPPYIDREDEDSDKERYQTVYAKHDGSVAAPTAGLHFTDALLKAIDDKGIKRAHVTLHVGGGTFLPVKVEDTKDHIMHVEHVTISDETARLINRTRAQGSRVIAVGTTSLRALETASDIDGRLKAFDGKTDIFITPGYRFHIADMLLTNFHLPRSTLFMLVCAFSGTERMKAAYAHAIAMKYRFYSYGDACLLYRPKQ